MDITRPFPQTSVTARAQATAVAIVAAAISALVIGLPTRLIANRWFSRMTPTRTQDYIFLVVSSLLIGATIGLVSLRRFTSREAPAKALASGGIGTVFAAGCPVCNKLIVAVIGTSGALRYFAPIQPALGVLSIGGLTWALRREYQSLRNPSCAAPGGGEQNAPPISSVDTAS